jgi:hypothetical protein
MITLRVRVKPKARRQSLQQTTDGTWLAEIRAAPVDGEANSALIRLIADQFKVRKSQVMIKSGTASRMKTIVIRD